MRGVEWRKEEEKGCRKYDRGREGGGRGGEIEE